MLVARDTQIPLFYREYEGNRHDSKEFQKILGEVTVAMRQAAPGDSWSKDLVFGQGMTWRRIFIELKAFLQIIWWQGIRTPYRPQFWSQLIGMWRQNPTRFVEYIASCAVGEDLFSMRRVVREKTMALIKERQLGVPAA